MSRIQSWAERKGCIEKKYGYGEREACREKRGFHTIETEREREQEWFSEDEADTIG